MNHIVNVSLCTELKFRIHKTTEFDVYVNCTLYIQKRLIFSI